MPDDDELLSPPCQRILDEQGYLIFANNRDKDIGTVILWAHGGAGYGHIEGPMVVIGKASHEEWVAQSLKFAGFKPARAYPVYLKVIAE